MKLENFKIVCRIPFDTGTFQFNTSYPSILSSFVNESEFTALITRCNHYLKPNPWPQLIIFILFNMIVIGLLLWKQLTPLWSLLISSTTLIFTMLYHCNFTHYSISINQSLDDFNKKNFKKCCISLVGDFTCDIESHTYIVVWINII